MSIRQIVGGLLLAVPVVALAQSQGSACKADVAQFCAQAKGGGKQQVMDCLLDHQKDISDGCYDALKQRLDKQQGFQACKEDAQKYCQGVQPGGGRIVKCLVDHQKDISDGCYDTLSKKMKGKQS